MLPVSSNVTFVLHDRLHDIGVFWICNDRIPYSGGSQPVLFVVGCGRAVQCAIQKNICLWDVVIFFVLDALSQPPCMFVAFKFFIIAYAYRRVCMFAHLNFPFASVIFKQSSCWMCACLWHSGFANMFVYVFALAAQFFAHDCKALPLAPWRRCSMHRGTLILMLWYRKRAQ